jgi:DtxR family Mn-dependent transcriptional regulator
MIYARTLDCQSVSTLELAESLEVKPASVTNMLQKLDEIQPKVVTYHKRRGVSLTPAGTKAALKIVRRHRLLEQFLFETLGYPWERVHAEAEDLEHVISPYFEDRLAAFLGEPEFDPHGEPIPNRLLELESDADLVQLAQLHPGERGIVRQVSSERAELLAYLGQIGLHPGVELQVLQRNPLDSTLEVLVGETRHFFSTNISEAIYVHLAVGD